jgi:hypothetical protein
MHDNIRGKAVEQLSYPLSVTDIHLFKKISRTVLYGGEGIQISGVCERVDIQDMMIGIIYQMTDQGTTNKPCTTRYYDFFYFSIHG